MVEQPQDTKHPFTADRPIRTRAEDLLGRGDFANALGDAIRGWKGTDSLVVALYGDWGSGKSSIINLMVEHLRDDANSCPEVRFFNPWHLSGEAQLATAFFHELRDALGEVAPEESKKKLREDLQKYASILVLAGSLAVTAGTSGVINPVVAGSVIKGVGEGFTKYFGDTKPQGQPIEITLSKLKERISINLADLSRPILIVLDDIDRLTPEEMKLVFRMIKANADFPNVIYLLAFDRIVVSKAMTRSLRIDGDQYLEKIVQVGFDVPAVDRQKLEVALVTGISQVFDLDRIQLRPRQQERLGNALREYILPFFRTLRDVKRYVGMLQFQVGMHTKDLMVNVNLTDLASLEVLRLLEPDVYRRLQTHRRALTNGKSGLSDQEEESLKTQLVSLRDASSFRNRMYVQEMLEDLFPVSWAFNSFRVQPENDENWLGDLRVAHSQNFDTYFRAAVSAADLSAAEVAGLLALSEEPEKLEEELVALDERKMTRIACERLGASVDLVPLKKTSGLLTALFNATERLHTHNAELHLAGQGKVLDSYYSLAFGVLFNQRDVGVAMRVFSKALESSNGLLLPTYVLAHEIRASEEPRRHGRLLISGKDMKSLQNQLLKKYEKAAANGKLLECPGLPIVLNCWSDWGGGERAKQWLYDNCENPSGLAKILVGYLYYSLSIGGAKYQVHYRVDIPDIERHMAISAFRLKVEHLDPQILAALELTAFETFQKAMSRLDAGKSFDDWHWDDED